jgi:hypothetical protein
MLQGRNVGGKHTFQVSEVKFDLITSYFVMLKPNEGFNVAFTPHPQ